MILVANEGKAYFKKKMLRTELLSEINITGNTKQGRINNKLRQSLINDFLREVLLISLCVPLKYLESINNP